MMKPQARHRPRLRPFSWSAGAAGVLIAGLLVLHRAGPANGQRVLSSPGYAITAAAMSPIRVVVNGNPLSFADQGPVMVQNRVLVPLRGVLQALGARVDWDPADQTVSARRGDTRVRLRVNSADASVNGRPITLDVPAQMLGGRVMVPLRFVSEAMGADVRWMDATQTVRIRLREGGGEGAPAPAVATPSTTAPDGPALFVQHCGNCHRIGEMGRGGIALDHVGAQHTQNWIEVQIRSPEQHQSRMPAFPPARLSDRDLRILSRYLAGLT